MNAVHLLILGYSSIVRRRVLPAARSLAGLRRISVASRSQGAADMPDGVEWYGDYAAAMASSGADVVYISGINTTHRALVSQALTHGLHTIVDKPAFLDVPSAEEAAALARRVGKGLAEATVFAFHPQASAVRARLVPAESASIRATATFSIPPLPPDDFRYRVDAGGGSLSDLGPYVAGANRLLFGTPPASVTCQVLSTSGAPAVDTSFSFLLTHGSGGALAGHCGFVTAYQNRMSVLSRFQTIDAERIFSTPPEMECALRVRDADGERSIAIPAADAFAMFLSAFLDAIARTDFTFFESALLDDARLVARLRQSAGQD